MKTANTFILDDGETTIKTANVRTWGTIAQAYAEPDGTVRVYSPAEGYFTTCHELTAAQLRHVRRVATN